MKIKKFMNFYDYCIKNHYGENSPVGDFVMDMKDSKDFPKSTNKTPYCSGLYSQCVADYLSEHHADRKSREIFEKLWDEYTEAAINHVVSQRHLAVRNKGLK